MANTKLRLASSKDSNSVALLYENIITKAERAYFFGQQEQVQSLYLQAFELSIQILNANKGNRISFARLINVCHDCFDLCPLSRDSDEHYFLEIAAESLATIMETRSDRKIRILALSAYSRIANLAAQLARYNQSSRAFNIVACYQRLQAEYG